MFYWSLSSVPELRDVPSDERTRLFKKFRWRAMKSPWPWLLGVPVATIMLLIGPYGSSGGHGLLGVVLPMFLATSAFHHGLLVAMRPMLRRERKRMARAAKAEP